MVAMVELRKYTEGTFTFRFTTDQPGVHMDILQKLIIFVTVFLVVSGLIWFIFLAH